MNPKYSLGDINFIPYLSQRKILIFGNAIIKQELLLNIIR